MKIITLDGPSGSGKSAIGPALAKRFGMQFISLGCLYRAIAWAYLEKKPLEAILQSLSLQQQGIQYLPSINGKVLDQELYTNPAIEAICPTLSSDPEIRKFVEKLVLALSPEIGLIAEGRTACKIFPKADCKIFLTAQENERLRRNLNLSRAMGIKTEEEQLSTLRKSRDEKDSMRKIDPLRIHSDMLVWDSTRSSFEQTVERLSRWVEHHVFDKKLRISVIIPVHNREEHLKHCLKALSHQTIDDFETIVVDDGSIDSSSKVAASYGAAVIQTQNRGPGAARNIGIARARGDIIAFLDADIVVKPDYLESLRTRHARTNDLLLLGARRHLPQGQFDFRSADLRLDSREKLLKRYSYCLSHLNHPWSLAYTCNLSLPKYLLDTVRFDESFIGWGLEDIDFAYQLYKKGARLAFSRAICGYHLYHDRSFSPARYQSWLQNLHRLLQKYPTPEIQSFALFKPVFNPDIQANYFDVFDRFENRTPHSETAQIDLSERPEDPLQQIQEWIAKNPNQKISLTDQEERVLYEIYLPFLGQGQIQSFIPKEAS